MQTSCSVSAEIFTQSSGLARISSSRKEEEDAYITLTVVDSSSLAKSEAVCVILTLEELCILREKIEMVIQHG